MRGNIKNLKLEDHNFRVNSAGWVKIRFVGGKKCLVNPSGDIWQIIKIIDPRKAHGEQPFTWGAAIRETEKAGKPIPTDQEFLEILRGDKYSMPNIVFPGYRRNDGWLDYPYFGAYFWSSTESGSDAWYRVLYNDPETPVVYRGVNDKTCGLSVRCLKN